METDGAAASKAAAEVAVMEAEARAAVAAGEGTAAGACEGNQEAAARALARVGSAEARAGEERAVVAEAEVERVEAARATVGAGARVDRGAARAVPEETQSGEHPGLAAAGRVLVAVAAAGGWV